MTNSEQRTACLTALAVAFNREATPEFFMAYLDMGLVDVPTPALKNAAGRAIRECKFMPTVAELRVLSGHAVMRLEDREPIAWQAVCQALRDHGYYRSVDFDDPAINATIRNLGGWEQLSDRAESPDFEVWYRKDFCRVYLAFCRNGVSSEAGAPLMGFFDCNNGLHGHGQKPPAKIVTGLPAPPVRRIVNGPKSDDLLKLTAVVGKSLD